MRMLEWILKHKLKAILVAVLVFALPLVIVHLLYKLNSGLVWLHTEWTAGDILTYIAGFEALCGTVILGLVSIYQSKTAQQTNERISKENNYLQKISVQKLLPLLKVESHLIRAATSDRPKSFPAENSIIVGESVSQNGRQFFVEVYLGSVSGNEVFSKETSLTLKNISEGVIRQIAFDQVRFSSFRLGSEVISPPICVGSDQHRFISTLLLPGDTIDITFKVFYTDIRYNNFWEYKNGAVLGVFDPCVYLTNTSITGIEYREKIYINEAYGFKGKVMYKAFEEEQDNA